MDFKDQIIQLSDRIEKLKKQIQTEEATKNAFIMPLIMALGYDIFNPMEVIPEFVCDIGTKKGEKIDYAIFKEGKPMILIECKHCGHDLNVHEGQLLRYFHVSGARFGILTNGIIYRFYTDLKAPNKMDEKPFFEINMTDIKENEIDELKKFHKSYFDIDNVLSTASELQYTNQLKSLIKAEMSNPSEGLVRHLAKTVYTGKMMAHVLEQFTELTRKSFNAVISEIITERLKTVLNKEKEEEEKKALENKDKAPQKDDGIVTTLEEMEAFYIVKAILSQKIPLNRVFHRDTKSYFGILLDNNNRKPICRLYLDGKKKYLYTIGEGKKETKHELESLDDIYKHAHELLDAVVMYEGMSNKP
ncbi:MAG: type I restriction enzyme HsdR N-terminal domain-containing protein [Candidatus Syntrophosphaera sp.]|nr:type I restriction enzyme HsdR N-terminal domain-containing protein [Candidatus Syntrophosphaera sp.]